MLLGSTYLTGALAARQLYAHSMETLWVTVGIVILALTLIDVFLTALNYDEAGFLAGRLAAWQWKALRSITRRLFAAMYFSAAQLATVGTSQLSPNTDVLRALSAKFSSSSPGSANVAETLAPFFPNGKPVGIDGHLQGISDSLSSYTDGLRLQHAAYYFQSGRESFSLQLGHQFDEFREYLHPLIGWQSTDVPETVDYTEFLAIMDTHAVHAPHEAATPTRLWALEFRWLNQDMARLTQSRQGLDTLHELIMAQWAATQSELTS